MSIQVNIMQTISIKITKKQNKEESFCLKLKDTKFLNVGISEKYSRQISVESEFESNLLEKR